MASQSQIDAAEARNASPAEAVENSLLDGKKHLLLAASGSVATIKLPLIVSAFSKCTNLSIRIVLTRNAAKFLAGQADEQPRVASLSSLPNVEGVYDDEDEWNPPWKRDSKILHIALRRWADILVIAPMSANLLGQITNGLCSDLLTSLVRAWDTDPVVGKRIVVAAAMNTLMYTHPLTAKQLATLRDEWGVDRKGDTPGWFEVLPTQVKMLACHDEGQGAMHDWKDIVGVIRDRLALTGVEV